MIAYKDMTFCPFYEDCKKQKACHRPLTPEVKAAADAWWKSGFPESSKRGGAPISMYTGRPSCHDQILKQ